MIPQKTVWGRIKWRLCRIILAISEECVKWKIPPEDSALRRSLLQKLGLNLTKPVFLDVGFSFEYGCNISIGPYTFLRQNAYLGDWDKISIGTGCTIARHLTIFTGDHNKPDLTVNLAPVSIGDFCYIAADVSVMPGVTIGDDCIIGSGSIVTRDIPDESIAFGSPAKVVSKRTNIPDIIYTGFGMMNRTTKTLVTGGDPQRTTRNNSNKVYRKLYSLAVKASYWVLPQAFIELLRWIVPGPKSGITPPGLEAEFARNKKFHNIHQGQRCFILATGPSINKQNLKPLKNEICLAVSLFWLHPDIKEIAPLYHVDAPNHPPYKFELPRKNFEGYEKAYSDRTIYFLGNNSYECSFRNFAEEQSRVKKENIHYLNYFNPVILNESNYKNSRLWDITKPLFGPRTVLYCAIQVAAYMGFKEIYLLGCDHDYLLELNRTSTRHFYNDDAGIRDSLWPSTEEYFEAYHQRWKEFRLMRQYLETKGCHIYNATEGGLLDVFPRVKLEEILSNR